MRTLAILAALLLLALQAQAQTVPGNTEETPDQEQPGEEDQDMEVSFAGAAASALQKPGSRGIRACRCARFGCGLFERNSGSCFQGSRVYTFCCRPIK